MENSATQDTTALSLSTQSVSSTVAADAVTVANTDSREHRSNKEKSYKLHCLALAERCDVIQKVKSIACLVSGNMPLSPYFTDYTVYTSVNIV